MARYKQLELKGLRFSKLLVLEQVGVHKNGGKLWKCICDCGNYTVVVSSGLNSGITRSCGCLKKKGYKDITGQVFGDLTAVRAIGTVDKHRSYVWECHCSCGVIVQRTLKILRNTVWHSCGHHKYQDGDFNALFASYRYKAIERGYSFELTKDEARLLFESKCFYCRQEPSQVMRRRKKYQYVYNGIDRVDNSKGYTTENTVSCCKVCNMAKGTKSVESFVNWIEKVYQNLCKH